MEQLFLTIIVLLISFAIIFTNAILGGLVILAFTIFCIIPILVEQIKEIKNNIDNK